MSGHGGHYMLCLANGLCVVFLGADWYRYLWIFKGVRGADFAALWQDYQSLISIKFSSKSLDITTLLETAVFSIYHHLTITEDHIPRY
jgi:hypothetical protein